MSINIRALTDRVVLEFPPEETEVGGITIPVEYRLRKEMGRLVAHGPTSSKHTAQAMRLVLRMSGNTAWQRWRAKHLPTLNRWLGWKRPSCRFLIPIAIGSRLWNDDILDKEKRFIQLAYLRSYNVTALSVAITTDDAPDKDAARDDESSLTPEGCLCTTERHLQHVANGGVWECACQCEEHKRIHLAFDKRDKSDDIRARIMDTRPFIQPDRLKKRT